MYIETDYFNGLIDKRLHINKILLRQYEEQVSRFEDGPESENAKYNVWRYKSIIEELENLKNSVNE